MTRFINQDADEGLRTLLFATKQIDRQSYEEWNTRYQNALAQVKDRDELVA